MHDAYACQQVQIMYRCRQHMQGSTKAEAHMAKRHSSFQSQNVYLVQKRRPYTGNLNSETSGDSKNAFLHCGNVLDAYHLHNGQPASQVATCHKQHAARRAFLICSTCVALRLQTRTDHPSFDSSSIKSCRL